MRFPRRRNLTEARRSLYYGWWIVLAATLALGLGSGISFWTFGVYFESLEGEFGWSRTQLSAAVSGNLLVAGLTGPVVGRWVDRHGARSAILLGSIPFGLSYLLLGAIQELWHLYVLYWAGAFFRTWCFYIPFQALLARWFSRRRGLAMGVASSGFSLGGMLLVPLIAYLVEDVGWRQAYVTSGLMVLVLFVPLAFFVLSSSPADKGLEVEGGALVTKPVPDDNDAAPSQDRSDEPWTLRHTLRSGAFWLLAAAFALFFLGRVAFLIHAVPFFTSRELGAGTGAALVSYTAAVALLVRPIFGLLADRVTDVRLLTVAMAAVHMAALAVVLGPTWAWMLALFVLLWGVGSGGGPVLEPLLLSRTFGVANFGVILGALGVVETLGMLLGPIIGGVVFDATGSYTIAFLIYIATFGIAALGFAAFSPPRRWRQPQAAPSAQQELP